MKLEFLVDEDEIRNCPNRNTKKGGLTAIYESMPISLYYRIGNDGGTICISLKIDNFHRKYNQVTIIHDVYVYKLLDENGNQNPHEERIGSNKRYSYDNGNNYGLGPFGMDYGMMDVEKLLSNQYIDPDGKIKFIIKIRTFNPIVNSEYLMEKIYNKLYQVDQDQEIDSLKEQNIKLLIDNENLSSEQKKLNEQLIKLGVENQEQESLNQTKMNKLEKELKLTRSILEESRKQNADLTHKIKQVEESLMTNQFDKLLMNFNPDLLNLDRPSEELNEISKKGMLLQIRVSEKLRELQNCLICKKEKRSYALSPCGHLYFCHNCRETKLENQQCSICEAKVLNTVKVIN